jgi:beta-xylosidase
MDSEQNITDIGAAITIKPPEGAMQGPTGIPTVPTGIPTLPLNTSTTRPATTTTRLTTSIGQTTTTTRPATTTTLPATSTSPTTGGTATFNDDFQGAWNSKWVWNDPNNDAKYSLTARPGFLRLTVPDGNDLAGFTNYDAPRLLVPQKGNFTLETLVEFDPKDVYQGAGLLVWQDEDTFLRLEFGFGGMGGAAKNVVLVKQEEGGLNLVDFIDLPDTLKRVELRLQRNNDLYTAWYRQVGGSWQKIGSTELSLNSTVNVGITQVTQYTPSQISADFDYFRVFSP